jgi:hypothetical protein
LVVSVNLDGSGSRVALPLIDDGVRIGDGRVFDGLVCGVRDLTNLGAHHLLPQREAPI